MTKIAGSGTISRGQLFFTDAAYSVISGIDISANQTYNFKSLLPENTVFVRIGVVANSNSGFNGVSVKFAFS